MPNRRRTFLPATCGVSLVSLVSLVGLAMACGGINDPTLHAGTQVATISGALTGTAVPSGAHVALVWRTGKAGYAVGADAPIVGGRFTMTLDTPPDAYFQDASDNNSNVVSAPGATQPPDVISAGTDGASPSSGGSSGTNGSSDAGVGGRSFQPLDVAGGRIAPPFAAALAGFVVYQDQNGNGVLDLSGTTAASPDKLLGGNSELFIADMRGGGALDYEKLRDKAGVLPTEGFNLAWTRERWLPLNEVELKLTTSMPHLPSTVCGSSNSSTTFPDTPSVGKGEPSGSIGGYPSPGDPNLHCSPDGRSFSYAYPCPKPPPPPPEGLCSSIYPSTSTPGCAGYGTSLVSGQSPPQNWPCAVAGGSGGSDGGADATAPKDAGPVIFDASTKG